MYKANAPYESEINIRHFLILALGGNHFIQNLINDIYEEKKWEYYEHYRNSGFTDDVVMEKFSTKSEDSMRKVAGIIEWCYNHDNFDILYRIIKKGFKYAYQYVQQRTHVDLEQFAYSYTKKKGGIGKVTDSELFQHNIVVLYLCYREGKPCNLQSMAGRIFQKGLQDTLANSFTKEINFNDEQLKAKREKIKELYAQYPVPPKFDEMNVSKLFEHAIDQKTEEIMLKERIIEPIEARRKVFKQPYIKEIGAFSGWVKALGIQEMDLTDLTPLSKKDMDIIFAEYLIAQDENDISVEQRDMFIVACMWMQALAYHYNETKRLYLDESKKEFFAEVKKREEIVRVKENEIASKEEQLNQQIRLQEERIKSLEDSLRKAKTGLRNEKQKQKELDDYSKEVFALRSYIYEQENKEEALSTRTVEEIAREIESFKIAIYGGHPNWQHKIKQAVPSLVFIDVDDMSKDVSFIDRFDAVFINTTFFNHSFYRKLMKQLSKNNTKLFYLDERTNVKLVGNRIVQLLNQ